MATVSFESTQMKFTRVTVNPNQMGGVPCIRGLRIPVATVVGSVADGMSEAEILEAYPDLTVEDIHEALRFAAEAVRERTLLELPVEERLKLVEALWESVAECPEALELTVAQKEELDRRLAAYERDPGAGVPWAELKQRLLAS